MSTVELMLKELERKRRSRDEKRGVLKSLLKTAKSKFGSGKLSTLAKKRDKIEKELGEKEAELKKKKQEVRERYGL